MVGFKVLRIGRRSAESSPNTAASRLFGAASGAPEFTASRLGFDRFVIDFDRATLEDDNGVIPLRPKTFELLRHFILNPGRLLSKDELMAAIWPDVIVTDDSLVQCVAELRRALGKAGQTLITTVPRRGYRFDGHLAEPRQDVARTPSPGRRLAWAGAISAAVAVLASLTLALLPADSGQEVPPLSFAVLPFSSAGDGTPAYLADALTSEITTDLARIPGLFVIANATARTFGDETADPREAGRVLGVRYILSGDRKSVV